jgi:hypothetical protein
MNDWISINDKLPEFKNSCFSEDVLITDGSDIYIGSLCDNSAIEEPNSWMAHDHGVDKITHWMPLPELPK